MIGNRYGKTILLVDDAPENIQILNKVLRDDYKIIFATNGKNALKSALNKKPDLIILDIVMPEMDGLQVCNRMQSLAELKDIPVIFITGKNDPETETQCFSCGAVDFITKPINSPVVRARVRTHLELKEQRDRLERTNSQLLTEIQERKNLEHRLREQAEFDALTKLPNRKLFQDRLQQTVLMANRTEQSFALMFIDLDRFKEVNDTLGHKAGDELLIEAAKRLNHVVRKSDTVARLGGDEFTVILPDIMHDSMADLVAGKILEQMGLPFQLQTGPALISASLGIAIFPHDGFTADELLRNADSAMYQAKSAGRNAFQFYSITMNQQVRHRLQLEGEMHNAIQREEFFLDFQPKVNIETCEIIGMEALVRWNHPKRGVLLPKEFISLAEESGMIIKIGAWVLQSACKEASKWIKAGFTGLKLAVNLSAIQLLKEDQLEALVEETLRNTGFPAASLELEITESMMVANLEQSTVALTRLRDMGITIFMDDFGTGHSSLSLLQNLPIQALKIDRSFVKNIVENASDSAMISAILSMARQLQLHVVSEGVENSQQLKIIQQLGGVEVQGFHYCPPLGADAFLALLKGHIPLGGL